MQLVECGQAAGILVAELRGELSDGQWNAAQTWLTIAERSRFESEVVGRAERFLAGRFLLRSLVAEAIGCAPSAVVVSAACGDCGKEHGAPVGWVGQRRVYASLSHTGSAHVAAVSENHWVGIDIESARTGVDVVEWTAREAASKLDGVGLRQSSRELADFELRSFNVQNCAGTLAWSSPPRS
jgi:phosphopantetheinyl transferase